MASKQGGVRKFGLLQGGVCGGGVGKGDSKDKEMAKFEKNGVCNDKTTCTIRRCGNSLS